MPGEYAVTIEGETWELIPPRGLAALREMPKVISFISQLIYSASRSGFNVQEFFSGDVAIESIGLDGITRLITYIAVALDDNMDKFEKDIVPFLLQREYSWLQERGSPVEYFRAIVVGIRMIIDVTAPEEVQAALKKSTREEGEEEEED